MKLETLLSSYRRERRPRPRTVQNRQEILYGFIRDTGVDDTDNVSFAVIADWRDMVLKRAAPTTWDSYWLGLRCLWNFGMEQGYFDRNPFAKLRREAPKKPSPKTVDQELIGEAIEYLLDDEEPLKPGWFWAVVVRMFYYTGMHRGELVSLRWCDISDDYKHCEVSTTHGNRERRRIDLEPEIGTSLRDLRRITTNVQGRQPFHDEQVFNVTLFYNRYLGGKMTTSHINGIFRRLSDAMGVKITPNILRDTMATLLLEHNQRVAPVARLLGHNDGRTTLKYLNPKVRDQRSVTGALPRL